MDQSRLTGRGPRDPGRLLREEKMRRRVKKEKPKVSFQRASLQVPLILTFRIRIRVRIVVGGRAFGNYSCVGERTQGAVPRQWLSYG